jgi:creatinase
MNRPRGIEIGNGEAGLEPRGTVETVLEPGMVVAMESRIMLPESQPGAGGYRKHDVPVITETANCSSAGFPSGPEHNIISN